MKHVPPADSNDYSEIEQCRAGGWHQRSQCGIFATQINEGAQTQQACYAIHKLTDASLLFCCRILLTFGLCPLRPWQECSLHTHSSRLLCDNCFIFRLSVSEGQYHLIFRCDLYLRKCIKVFTSKIVCLIRLCFMLFLTRLVHSQEWDLKFRQLQKFILFFKIMIGDAQIPGARPPWRLNFVRWRLIICRLSIWKCTVTHFWLL
jgi:hypothetical protein